MLAQQRYNLALDENLQQMLADMTSAYNAGVITDAEAFSSPGVATAGNQYGAGRTSHAGPECPVVIIVESLTARCHGSADCDRLAEVRSCGPFTQQRELSTK